MTAQKQYAIYNQQHVFKTASTLSHKAVLVSARTDDTNIYIPEMGKKLPPGIR